MTVDSGDDTIAVHGGECVFSADVEVRFAGFFIEHMGGTAGVELDHAGEKIGFLWDNVAILANAGDIAREFHLL